MVKSATMSGISARARQFVATGAGWGILPLLSASMLWGTSGTAQALAHLQVDPPRIGATRLLCGAAALIVIAAVTGRLRARELIAPGRRRWLVTAGVATAVYQAAFFAALSRTGVALGTLVALGSAQRSAGCSRAGSPGSRCRARGRSAPRARSPAARCWCCPTAAAGGADLFGVALSVLAGACYGAYTVCLKGLLGADADPMSVLAVTVTIGAVLLSPFLITGGGALASPAGLLLAAWLGLAVTAGAYLLFARGLARVPARTAGTLSWRSHSRLPCSQRWCCRSHGR
jgi:drug/metabolite transporter (DMT)-like permease